MFVITCEDNVMESEYPKEHPQRPGFFHIATRPHLWIDRHGWVYDDTKKITYPPILPDGDTYARTSASGGFQLHRLLAIAFLIPPGVSVDEVKDLMVNHLDGNKKNFDLSNLEWTTPSGNALHAYETGLRNDNREIQIRDLRTGEETTFYSLQKAARFFKVNGEKLHRYLKRKGSLIRPFETFYELIYKGEAWRGLTYADIQKSTSGGNIPVACLKDDHLYVFGAITEAAQFFNVSDYKIRTWLRDPEKKGDIKVFHYTLYREELKDMERRQSSDDDPTRRYGKPEDYQFSSASNPHRSGTDQPVDDEWVQRPLTVDDLVSTTFTLVDANAQSRVIPKRKGTPIEVHDTVKGTTTTWSSSQAFAESMGVKKNTLQKYLWTHNGRWKHYVITYLNK